MCNHFIKAKIIFIFAAVNFEINQAVLKTDARESGLKQKLAKLV